MSKVATRIQHAAAGQVITLADGERRLFQGAGVVVARFCDGVLEELFDPLNAVAEDGNQSAEQLANEAVVECLAWFRDGQHGPGIEFWLTRCSRYEFFDPIPIIVGGRFDIDGLTAMTREIAVAVRKAVAGEF